MLRTIRNFKPFSSAIEAVYLVEASPSLREAQHKLLCGDKPLEEIDIGHRSLSKYTDDLRIIWCEDIRFVPKESTKTPFIVAHEFFDALPIHVFQSVPPASPSEIKTPTGSHPVSASALRTAQTNQWRELLVSPTSPYAISKPENPSGPAPEFELTLAKASTPNSLYLPELSNRYRAVKSINDALVEISPESQEYAADFAVRIGGGVAQSPAPVFTSPSRSSPSSTPAVISGASSEPQSVRPVRSAAKPEVIEKPTPSGAALILDYGSASSIPTNSLRGIKAHTRVSPFSEPGLVDISADVDFLALAESAINASLGVEVHGPVDQARFLTSMGIQERAAQLVKRVVDVERGAT
ncbi:hypothetical protein H2203_007402 [Taxawa tesnikishii (nom. ined.)]|nr:hypothetical protein H2203_007402 [Dothideales sp. JES 119]